MRGPHSGRRAHRRAERDGRLVDHPRTPTLTLANLPVGQTFTGEKVAAVVAGVGGAVLTGQALPRLAHRVLRGEDPGCVAACLFGARIFGRTDDPESEVSKILASGRAKKLYPEFGTDPGVLTYIIES